MSGIRDVARAAGVSTATVSHVINDSRKVSDATRARVLAAVERCGYYPNLHARSLASGRSRTLGLVISDISNPFFPELVKAIEDEAYARGYEVVLSNTNYDAERTSRHVARLIERQVAGVALMTSELDAGLIRELARREVAVVFLDLGEPGLHMSNLCVEYEAGVGEALRHLVGLGHERVAFVTGPRRLRSAAKRLDAFRLLSRELLPRGATKIYDGDFKLEGGRRAAREMLAEAEKLPTAVFAANDLMALGLMSELRSAGLNVPRDVSVIGFDDIEFAALAQPALTTVRLPRGELGRSAVEALMETVNHPERRGIEIRIRPQLVVRGSTAPASSGVVKSSARRRVQEKNQEG